MNDEQELLKVIWTLKVIRTRGERAKKRIPYREKRFAIQTAGRLNGAIERARTSETAN